MSTLEERIILIIDRINSELTLQQIADEIGISRRMISHYKNGKHSPSVRTADRILALARRTLGPGADD